ncbi:MAG: GAF domain-containing protein [Anaerolineae bacterium]
MNAKRTILIVDDDPKLRRILSDILGARGYAPTAAATGKAALDRVEEEMPVVALIDLKLEDMSGLEVMRGIKECCPATECIVLTGYATQKSAIEAVNLGAYSYVQKPYDMEQLLVTIRRAIEKREAKEAQRESEELLRATLESTADGILVVGGDGKMLHANARFSEMWRIPQSVLDSRDDDTLLDFVLDQLQDPEAFLAKVRFLYGISEEDFDTLEFKDGRVYERFSRPLLKNGATVGRVWSFHDITERKRAEERVQRLLDQQTAANQLALALGETRDLDEIYHTIYQHVLKLMDAEGFIVSFYDDETQLIRAGYVVSKGTVQNIANFPPIPLEEVGYGTQSQVIHTGAPYYVPDYRKRMERTRTEYTFFEDGTIIEEPPPPEDENTSNSALYVPMKIEGETIGVMQVQSHQLDGYSQEDMDLLSALANVAAIAIQNTRLYEETRSRAERLAAVNHIARAAGATLHLDDLMGTVYREITSVFQADAFFIALYDEGANELDFRLLVDEGAREPPSREPLGVGLTSLVVTEKKPLLIRDLGQEQDRLPSPELWGTMKLPASWLGAPMLIGEQLIGVICMQAYRPRAYGEEDQLLLSTIADQVAVAIENARLFGQAQQEIAERKQAQEELQHTLERLRKALGGIIQAVALTVETKDPYTAGHQRRVGNLARAIATEMGLSQEQIDGIRMAGLIHDLGKVSIPAEILSKPGRLSDFEWGIIKMHSQIGYDILKTVDFPWPVAQIVLQHHERMEGSGYPQGLSGEEIMLEARILAVADVVEAMASHRPYRPLRGLDKALEEISQNRGVLYDAEVVDVCLKLFTEKGFAFE